MINIDKYFEKIGLIQEPLEAMVGSFGEFTYLTDGYIALRVPRQEGYSAYEYQFKDIKKKHYYNPKGKYIPLERCKELVSPIEADEDGCIFDVGFKRHVLTSQQIDKIKLLPNIRINLTPINEELYLSFMFACGWGVVMLAEK